MTGLPDTPGHAVADSGSSLTAAAIPDLPLLRAALSILKIPTAKVFEPLLQPARYKGAFGGRGSGKSHFFGELLVEVCQAERGTLAVCIREAQRTLAQSSKRLVESKIASLGVGAGFKLYSDKIATPGDGAIIFRGMRYQAVTPMNEADVKAIVMETLIEQERVRRSDIDAVVVKTIATILTSFGIEEGDRKELRADFQHLRRWRRSVEQAQSYTFKAVITVIATGFIGAVWLGIKATLGK